MRNASVVTMEMQGDRSAGSADVTWLGLLTMYVIMSPDNAPVRKR